jgi:hypothetical protein
VNWLLAQTNLPMDGSLVGKAKETLELIAREPLEWWLAGLTIGSLVCVYMVVRKMLGAQRESNKALLDMVREKDTQLTAVREKMISLLEDRWKQR